MHRLWGGGVNIKYTAKTRETEQVGGLLQPNFPAEWAHDHDDFKQSFEEKKW